MKCLSCRHENTAETKFCGHCGLPLPSARAETLQAPMIRELARGSTFAGRFEVIEELGRGGMGRVYKVFDAKTREKIALKLLKPEISSDEDAIERFGNELRFARKISHRNVCRMYDLGDEQGTHYITMEYVPGEDLKSMLRMMGQMSAGKTLHIAKQACEGLAEAHRLGVVHRDLKPQNIMIDREGNVRIMDFGIARSLKMKGLTGAGVVIGTPEYMSPEQMEGKEADNRSDIYSLGVILYEMVTGKLPFEGDTFVSIALKQKTETPKPPRELNASIPDDLSRLILRCLERDPQRRYPGAEDVLTELGKIEKGVPTTEKVLPLKKAATSGEITVKVSIKKRLIPFLIAGGIVILAFLIWMFFVKRPAAPPPRTKPSIAVLPFTDSSPNKDQAALCAGLGDEIIDLLSRLDKFDVKSKYAVRRFRDKEILPRAVGEELQVSVILIGEVTGEKDETSISAELTDVKSLNRLWGGRFPVNSAGLFQIQKDIVREVADKLRVTLSPEDTKVLDKRPTESNEAHILYLQGRFFWNKRTQDGFRKAIECYRKATEIDPRYAPAYSGLSDAYTLMTPISAETMAQARDAANTALALNPTLAEAHASLGQIMLQFEFNVNGAEQEFRRAVDLDPNYPTAHLWYGRVLTMQGRFEDAINQLKKAIDLDPTSALFYQNLGAAYLHARRFDEAIVQIKKSLEIQPGDGFVLSLLAWAFFYAARYQDVLDLSLDPSLQSSGVGEYFVQLDRARKGEKTAALEYLYKNEKTLASITPTLVAIFYAYLGDRDRSFFWADRAVNVRDWNILYIKNWPLSDEIRGDNRFKDLLKRIGLADR